MNTPASLPQPAPPAEHEAPPGVVVVGSINLDFVAHTARLPAAGETVAGLSLHRAHGGKGGNQAVAAARLGARVAMLARVGAGDHGPALVAELAREGIAVGGIRQVEGETSGTAIVMVSAEGENSIVYIAGANMALSPDDVGRQAALLRAARVVVGQLEVPVAALKAAFTLARAAGVTTILNAAPAAVVDAELLGLMSWLVVNASEAALMTSSDVGTPAQALRAAGLLRKAGAERVVLTLGAQGAVLADAAGTRHFAAARAQSIDSTGAGDTFIGAFATALSEGATPDDALAFGQAAAAWAVARPGAREAMPKRADLKR